MESSPDDWKLHGSATDDGKLCISRWLLWFFLKLSSFEIKSWNSLQLINHTKSIKNWHNWKWRECNWRNSNLYANNCSNEKRFPRKMERKKIPRAHLKRESSKNCNGKKIHSHLARHYCEHNFAFKQLMNGKMSETIAKAIELWP